MKVARDSWLVFRRYFGRSLASPAYIGVSLGQPVLYLILFAPILKSVAQLPGFPHGGAYNVFVPGLLVQLGLFSVTSGGWAFISKLKARTILSFLVTPGRRLAMLLRRSHLVIVVVLRRAP